jgi:hypothetical protein
MATPALVNPYEQIWKTRDLRALETPLELDNKLPEWRRGLGAFGKEMQATGYGLAALGAQGVENLVGENQVTSGITDWGLEGYDKAIKESHSGLNAPSVARIEDIKGMKDATNWASYQLGKGLPMLGSLALSGGVGGAIARLSANQGVKALAKTAVGDTVKKAVATKALQAAEGQVVTKAMQQAAAKAIRDRTVAGAMTGGFAGSFGLEGGLAFGEQVAEGVDPADAVKSAIAVGGINGALEFLPFYVAAKSIGMGQYAKKRIAEVISENPELSKRAIGLAKEIGGRALKGGAVGLGAEGITEGLQELTNIAGLRWAKEEPLFAELDDDDWSRIINGMAAGALVGGVALGTGATLGGPRVQEGATPPGTPPTVAPPAAGTLSTEQMRIQAYETAHPGLVSMQEMQAKRDSIAADMEAARTAKDMNKYYQLEKLLKEQNRSIAMRWVLINKEFGATQGTPPAQPAGTPPVDQTRVQALETMRQRIEAELEAARTAGDTARVEKLTPVKEQLDRALGVPTEEAPIVQPPAEEALPVQETPPVQEIVPTQARPGETIQMKRGDEVILTPPKPGESETRVVPTEEEKANLQQLLGERPDRTQPEVIPNAEEVQAQTETPVDTRYSMPGRPQPKADATERFDSTVIERNAAPKFKSRDKLVSMPIADFLAMADKLEVEEKDKTANIAKVLNENTPLSDLPFLQIKNQGAKGAKVVGHEGRHRALELQRRGYTHMPVVLATQDGGAGSIRWSQQADKANFDYVEDANWPAELISENSSASIPFPVTREGATAAYGEDTRYSMPTRQETKPTFYSELPRAVKSLSQKKATGTQWVSTLDNMVKKGQIKKEEMDWIGLNDWLKEQGTVSKEDVMNFIKENEVVVEEVELGNEGRTAKLNGDMWEVYDKSGNLLDSFESFYAENETEALDYIGTSQPRNTNWTLSGGQNQRELVITSPNIESYNTDDTTHYGDIKGGRALAWVRLNDRVSDDGKKVLFVEEIQSKRHQEGKQIGYKRPDPDVKELARFKSRLNELHDLFESYRKNITELSNEINELLTRKQNAAGFYTTEIKPGFEGQVEKLRKQKDNLIQESKPLFNEMEDVKSKIFEIENKYPDAGIPDAPFKQTIAGSSNTLSGWAGLAFKRMLRYAAENGYEQVAWTTGEQQAQRYNLGNIVSKVAYNSVTNQLMAFDRNDSVVLQQNVTKEELPQYIGQDVAKQLLNEDNRSSLGVHRLDFPEGTVIGGEGMKGFYDRLLPKEISKYVKKWGAKVGTTEIKLAEGNVVKFGDDILHEDGDWGESNNIDSNAAISSIELIFEQKGVNEALAFLKENKDEGSEYHWIKKNKHMLEYVPPDKEVKVTTHSVTITPEIRESVMQGQPLFSKTPEASAVQSITPEELRNNIDSFMGPGWLQQAEAAGIIEVIDGPGTRGESGSWSGGKFRLYTQSMPADGSPLSVLLHEGSHAPTFNEMLGDSIGGYLKDLQTLADNENQAARNAIAQATIASADVLGIKHNLAEGGSKADLKNIQALIEEQAPGLLAEEKLAYFIQYATDAQGGAGFLKRLINAIKAWFAQTQLGQALKEAGIGFELNEAMAVEWAKRSLQKSLANAQQAAQVREQVINEAKLMSPSERLGRALEALYSYAGPRAAIANLNSLQAAKERTLNEDPETVRKETGWFKGKDNKWRFEIDDKEFSFNDEWIEQQRKERVSDPEQVAKDFEGFDLGAWEPDTQWSQGEKETRDLDEGDFSDRFETTIGQLVNHPKLFEAYPQLRGIEVDFLVNTRGTFDPQGYYSATDNSITIKDYTYASAKKVLIHELQHAVQDIEGFAAGGAPDNPTTYLRLAGEIEARDTARRLDMTPEQRQEKQPYMETMFRDGIADNDVIVTQSGDIYYSMGIKEISEQLWNDPTDSRQEIVNKPGVLQKWRADFVDFFAEIEKKSTQVYDAYSLLRNKKAARLVQARQEYHFPLRELIANGPWSAKEVGDMLAARHVKVDKVNIQLAERASDSYTKELLKALSVGKKKDLMQARVNVKAGKMPDGTNYVDANGNPAIMSAATKRKFMFDLMNKYAVFEQKNPDGIQELREEWELFKDAAAGFSDGGIAAGRVRTADEVLQGTAKDQVRFDKIANLFDAMNRHALQIREDGGLITAAEHARLLTDKTAYAPLRRESYNVDLEIQRLFQRAGQGGSKQLGTRAGTAALSEPTLVLQNALAALEASAAAAERNLANKELYKVVVADRKEWKPWFTIVEEDKYATHDADGFLQDKNATASNRADIVLINDGKKLIIRPNMHNERAMGFVRAVNNLDAQDLNGPMKVLGWFNNIVRWVNVTASPVFLMMNAVKDPFTAAYNIQASEAAPYTKEIFTNYGRAFKALKKVFMDGNRDPTDADVQWVEKFENAGGRTSFIEALKESDTTWRSFDAQVARRQGSLKQLMAFKDTAIDGIENLNILFENVMRFSAFQTLVEKGVVTESRAARIAQDLTTNFSRRGYKSQALGVWWLFFNATVQGNYQVLRNVMSSRRVQVAAGGTIIFALMLDLLGRAVADDWDEIPEWDKERFIIIPVKVGGDFVRIPAPWVYNSVWRTGGLLGEMLAGVKKPQDAVLDIASMTATTFSPLGKPGSIAQAISPTAGDPFVQILENKDFAGNPLGPEGFPGAGSKANSELIWNKTPPGFQSIARTVNEFTGGSAVESGLIDLRPADYQVLAKFLTGSLGRFLSDATFGLKEGLDKGIEGPKDIPVIKELFADPYNPMRSQQYHENIASVYAAHKLEKMYRQGPEKDLVKLHEVRTERDKELRMYNQAADIERQIKSLRVRIRAAQNRKDDARVRELRTRIKEIQEKFNRSFERQVG